MKHLAQSRLFRGTLALLLAALIVPAVFAQDAPQLEPQKEQEKESRYQKEAMEVIARYIEAIGGEEALRKHKHRTVRGELSRDAINLRGPFQMHLSAPNRLRMTLEMAGVGEVSQGYNGKVAWSIDQMRGPMIIEDPQAEDVRRQADFYGELNYRKNYKEIEYVGRENFDGADAHKIRLVDRMGRESFAFFDAESHLFVGVRSQMDSEMGSVPMTTFVSEYREFDGVKMPTVTRVRVMMDELKMKIESVSHDEIPESTYELPEAIKALLPEEEEEEEKEEPAAAAAS